jgi:hypothetical protein
MTTHQQRQRLPATACEVVGGILTVTGAEWLRWSGCWKSRSNGDAGARGFVGHQCWTSRSANQ